MYVTRMSALHDLEQLLPHRPPFRLVDRLLSSSASEAVAERRVTQGDPLVNGQLPGPLVLEALAQTAALMMGTSAGPHRGFLVALKDVHFEARVRVGDTLTLRARRTATLGALHRVLGEARVDDLLIARGELTFAVEAPAATVGVATAIGP